MALEMFTQSFEIKEKVYAREPNKSYSNTLNNLGLTFQSLKSYDLAVKRFTQTLEYYKR